MTLRSKLTWAGVAVLGAISFAIVALRRGEPVNGAWLVVAALCIHFIAYRVYPLFIADRVFGIDPGRPTPAHRHDDSLDYVPTDRYVLFGHHFAAIAGAAAGRLLAPAKSLQEMGWIVFNDYVDAALAGVFAAIVVIMAIYGVLQSRKALANPRSTAVEIGVAGAMAGRRR